MKYLDERIILTVPNLTIPEDGLYQYEIGISDEWVASDPYFVGNCFIPKNSTERTIDITDIVRNEIDFTKDINFQEEWQVRIKVGENYFYSNSETVLPIYRYPNRKAEMETPIEPLKDGWYIPSLQGFDSQKKAKMLPHIPYLATKELSYELWMNNGKMTTTPYLYSGVKKSLDNNSYGIRKNSWSLEDLWKGETNFPTLNYSTTWFGLNDEADSKYCALRLSDDLTGGTITFTKFPYYINRIRLSAFFTNEEDQEIEVNYTGDIGSRTYTYSYTSPVNTYDNVNTDYVDFYMNSGDSTFLYIYPEFVTPFTTGSYSINLTLSEVKGANHPEWITIPEGGSTFDGGIIQLPTFTEKVFNIFLRDANDNNIQNLGSCSENKPVNVQINPTTEAAKIVYTDVVNNNVFLTMEIPNSEVLTKNTAIFYATANGIVQFTNAYWSGTYTISMNANYEYENVNDTIDVVDKVDKRFYGIHYTEPNKGDLIFDKSNNYDSIIDNGVVLWFDKGTIDKNEYAGTEWYNVVVWNKVTNEIIFKQNTYFYINYNFIWQWGDNPQKPEELEVIVYIYNTQLSDYYAKIVIDFDKKIGDYISGISIKKNDDTNEFKVINLQKYYATPSDKSFPVATIDYCPSRYYLQWRDRYGSMMMRPFTGITTPKMNYTNAEIKNYQNVRRLASSSSQLSFEINSEWIKFELIPYYESIFCSPYLKLYDTQEDHVYDVIVKENEYIEKTFRNNNGQLYSLKLTLEENKTQDIIY